MDCFKTDPDEKGTESLSARLFLVMPCVSRLIPMKRELKGLISEQIPWAISVSRLIPMKRELKGAAISSADTCFPPCFKTDPDEKGTERLPRNLECVSPEEVSRLIPMKRELKDVYCRSRQQKIYLFQD